MVGWPSGDGIGDGCGDGPGDGCVVSPPSFTNVLKPLAVSSSQVSKLVHCLDLKTTNMQLFACWQSFLHLFPPTFLPRSPHPLGGSPLHFFFFFCCIVTPVGGGPGLGVGFGLGVGSAAGTWRRRSGEF